MEKHHRQVKKTYKTKALLFGSIVLLIIMSLAVVIFLIWKNDPRMISNEIAIAVLSTLITILFIQLGFQIYTNEEHKHSVETRIMDSISADNKIIGKYQNKSVEKIIQNCFDLLLGEFLSDKFMRNVIDRQLKGPSYRTDYKYNVYVEASGANEYRISQDISYRKCIKRRGRKPPKFARFFFSFEGDPFSAYKDDNSIIFFREELTSDRFREELRASKTDMERIELLNFRIRIESGGVMQEVDPADITASIIDNMGLMIEVPIEKEHITEDSVRDTYEYMAAMTCNYPARDNHFYCAFPEPTVYPSFSIRFPNMDIRRVNKVAFLSSEDYDIKPYKDCMELVSYRPKEKDVIFPHSGIIFFWNEEC